MILNGAFVGVACLQGGVVFAYDLGGPEGRDTMWGPEATPEGDAQMHDRVGACVCARE